MIDIAIPILIIIFLTSLIFGIHSISNNNIVIGGVSLFIAAFILASPFLYTYIYKHYQNTPINSTLI